MWVHSSWLQAEIQSYPPPRFILSNDFFRLYKRFALLQTWSPSISRSDHSGSRRQKMLWFLLKSFHSSKSKHWCLSYLGSQETQQDTMSVEVLDEISTICDDLSSAVFTWHQRIQKCLPTCSDLSTIITGCAAAGEDCRFQFVTWQFSLSTSLRVFTRLWFWGFFLKTEKSIKLPLYKSSGKDSSLLWDSTHSTQCSFKALPRESISGIEWENTFVGFHDVVKPQHDTFFRLLSLTTDAEDGKMIPPSIWRVLMWDTSLIGWGGVQENL